MRAVQFAEYGGPEVLRVGEAPDPQAGPGQVRIAVRAAGVNPIDWKIRSGAYQAFMPVPLPHVPGADAAGVVDQVGEGVTDVAAGDEVFGFAVGGAAAERTLLAHYARKPGGMPWAEAGALPVAVETAVRVFTLLGLWAGQTLLVNGAAGGVGIAAVQLATARGATVVGTASEANHGLLRELGVTPTTYGPGLVERVRALVPDGVDLAFDTAGRGALPDLVAVTGSAERVVTIADGDAAKHGVRFTGGADDPRAYEALAEAAARYEEGRFSLPVEATFPLEEAAEAHRRSESGHVRGKLVLVV